MNGPQPRRESAPRLDSNTQARRRLPRLSDILLGCVVLSLAACLAVAVMTRVKITAGNAGLTNELELLRRQSRLLGEQRRQARLDKDVIIKVFRQCRSAADIPDLDGKLIVSNLIDSDALVFYVPDGEHTLRINTSWEYSPPTNSQGDDSADPDQSGDPIEGDRVWNVPLTGDTGYHFVVSGSDTTPGPIGWQLRSNASDPQSESDSLPLPPLKTGGASWSNFRVVEYPNRISIHAIITSKPDQTIKQDRPLQIGRWTKFAAYRGSHLKIYFDLTIHSVAPAVVTAEDAESLSAMRRSAAIGDYLGDGIYRFADSSDAEPTAGR